jgi:glycosyltransferase involved in cell wall biosynthesis
MSESGTGPHVCVFTIHRCNDQRILRQIRSLHGAGYTTTLIDLGPVGNRFQAPGDERITLVLPRLGRLSRVLATGKIAWRAWRTRADIYHFHDLWLLPAGVLVRLLRRRPVVYDVHEYYPETYAARVPVGGDLVRRAVATVEGVCTRILGHASVVYPEVAERLGRRGARTALTPNFPSVTSFRQPPEESLDGYAGRLRRIVHTGGLHPGRGSRVLVDVAREIDRRGLDVSLTLVRFFPQGPYRRLFEEYLVAGGIPRCLEMHDLMHPDVLGQWLHQFGIGLSATQYLNPANNAEHTKHFEYALSGLTIVTSDLPRCRRFIEQLGHGHAVPVADPAAYVDAIERIVADPAANREKARRAAAYTAETMTWERSGGPALLELYAGAVRVPEVCSP